MPKVLLPHPQNYDLILLTYAAHGLQSAMGAYRGNDAASAAASMPTAALPAAGQWPQASSAAAEQAADGMDTLLSSKAQKPGSGLLGLAPNPGEKPAAAERKAACAARASVPGAGAASECGEVDEHGDELMAMAAAPGEEAAAAEEVESEEDMLGPVLWLGSQMAEVAAPEVVAVAAAAQEAAHAREVLGSGLGSGSGLEHMPVPARPRAEARRRRATRLNPNLDLDQPPDAAAAPGLAAPVSGKISGSAAATAKNASACADKHKAVCPAAMQGVVDAAVGAIEGKLDSGKRVLEGAGDAAAAAKRPRKAGSDGEPDLATGPIMAQACAASRATGGSVASDLAQAAATPSANGGSQQPPPQLARLAAAAPVATAPWPLQAERAPAAAPGSSATSRGVPGYSTVTNRAVLACAVACALAGGPAAPNLAVAPEAQARAAPSCGTVPPNQGVPAVPGAPVLARPPAAQAEAIPARATPAQAVAVPMRAPAAHAVAIPARAPAAQAVAGLPRSIGAGAMNAAGAVVQSTGVPHQATPPVLAGGTGAEMQGGAAAAGAGAQRAGVPNQAARHVPAGSSRLQLPDVSAVAGAGTQPGARVPAGRTSPSPVAGPNPSSRARMLGDTVAAGGGGDGSGAAAAAVKEVNLRELVARAVRTHTRPCAHADRRMMHALFSGAGGHPQWPCMSLP